MLCIKTAFLLLRMHSNYYYFTASFRNKIVTTVFPNLHGGGLWWRAVNWWVLVVIAELWTPKGQPCEEPIFHGPPTPFSSRPSTPGKSLYLQCRIQILAPCSSWFFYLNFWTLVLLPDGLSLHWLSCSCVLCCRQQIRCNEETQYELSCGISFHNCEASGNGRRCDTDRHQPDNCNSSKGFTSQPSQHWSCKAQHQ